MDSIEDAEREHSPAASEAFEIEEKERSILALELKLGLTVQDSSVFVSTLLWNFSKQSGVILRSDEYLNVSGLSGILEI